MIPANRECINLSVNCYLQNPHKFFKEYFYILLDLMF
jgi:hypothetical protein